MKTKSGEKEKLREKIIDQSIKVIKKKGISGASVDTIMESLGLTSGSLYSHFSGKDDLLALSIEKHISSLTDFISELLEKDRKDGLIFGEKWFKNCFLNWLCDEVFKCCFF